MAGKSSYKYRPGTPTGAGGGRARMLDEAVERASRGNVSKTHRAPRVRDEVSERQIVRR